MFNYLCWLWPAVSPLRCLLLKYSGWILTLVLHVCVPQLVKQCQAMLEAGRVYCQTSKSFVNGLRELGHQCPGDKMMEVRGAYWHTSHTGSYLYTHVISHEVLNHHFPTKIVTGGFHKNISLILMYIWKMFVSILFDKTVVAQLHFLFSSSFLWVWIAVKIWWHSESNLRFLSCRNVWTNFPEGCLISWRHRGWVCLCRLLLIASAHSFHSSRDTYQLQYVVKQGCSRLSISLHLTFHSYLCSLR